MDSPISRITRPTLEVLSALLEASEQGAELHGWEIAQRVGRPAPTVYRIFERLAEASWITEEWETLPSNMGRPRRCYVRLTAEGIAGARELL